MENIGTIAGFVLTLMIFSYVLGDNFLYRIAVYILVGLSAGFITIVTWESVLAPFFVSTIQAGMDQRNLSLIGTGILPILLGVLILTKSSSRIGGLGNLAIAFIVGVGTAVAMVGAVNGTLIPLTLSTGNTVEGSLLNTFILFIGVICSLVYFQYIAVRRGDQVQRALPVQFLSMIGQGFIVITLGALYAAAILTSLTIFSERVSFLLSGG